MTISTQLSKTTYAGNGVTTQFPVPFPFQKDEDIRALLLADGSKVALAQGTHYTLCGAGESTGGSLTMLAAPASGQTLVIWRSPAIVQEVDYVENAAFPAETHEGALDLLTMICQSLQEQIGRAVLYPVSTKDADILDSSSYLEAVETARDLTLAARAEAQAAQSGAQAACDVARSAAVAATDIAASADGLVKVSASDGLAQTLSSKLVAGDGLAETLLETNGAQSLSLSLDPASSAAALGYSRRRRNCNGGFPVDNFYNGSAMTPTSTSGVWVVENGLLYIGAASKLTAQRVTSSIAEAVYAERLTVASAYSPASGELFGFAHSCEGYDVADFQLGTANAKASHVRFALRVSVAGKYAFRVSNSAGDRAFVFTQTLTAGDNVVSKTIPGDTTGTWDKNNVRGLRLWLDMGCGSTYETAVTDAWQAGNYMRTADCVKLVEHAGATYEISNIQIELGSFATPFEQLPFQQEEAWCQRYHPTFYVNQGTLSEVFGHGCSYANTNTVINLQHKVPTRANTTGVVATPSLFYLSNQTAGGTIGTATSIMIGTSGVLCSDIVVVTVAGTPVTAAGQYCRLMAQNALARIRLTGAEL
jgi:hypothetical protein